MRILVYGLIVGAGIKCDGRLSHLVLVAAGGVEGLEASGTQSSTPCGHCNFGRLEAVVHYVLATLGAVLRVREEAAGCRRVCLHLRR